MKSWKEETYMGKVKLLLEVVGDLRSLADSLQAVADAVVDSGAAEAGKPDAKETEKAGKAGKAAKKEEKPAANKIPGIRAALCTDCFCAEATRQHNDANILCMGGRVVGVGLACKIVDTFLDTPFSNDERHIRRIRLIED